MKEDPPSSYATNLFQQANDLIKQMALEARSVPDIVQKRTLLDKVRTLKDQISALQNEVNKKMYYIHRPVVVHHPDQVPIKNDYYENKNYVNNNNRVNICYSDRMIH